MTLLAFDLNLREKTMDNDERSAALFAIRTNRAYQAAEALRRKSRRSVAALATDASDSAELGAILLLIGTWETIARMLKDVDDKGDFFEVLPVCYMWHQLWPAIKYFRTVDPDYAKHFGDLAKEYDAWLDKTNKDTEYRTANCNFGIRGWFG
jgi:hypothetical protein